MARNAVEILISVRDEATAALRRVRQSTEREFESLTRASGLATRAFLAIGGAAIGAGTGMVALAGRLEQSQIAFETLLGSAEAAGDYLEELADFAARTPFDFQGVQDSTRLLLAFGFQAEAAIPIVETLGDATSALGGSTVELEGIARALGQIQTRGTLVAQEMLQLTERGIPAFQILQEQLGLTNEQLGDIGSQGIDAQTAITAILTGLQERFSGAMERQSRTMLGLWSTIKDVGQLTMMELGGSIAEALDISGVMETAIAWMESFRERVVGLDLRQLFLDNRDAIAAMAGAVTAMMLPALISLGAQILRIMRPLAAMGIAGALVVDVARQLGVDFSALVNPTGILARVGTGFMGLVDIFQGVSTSIANLIRATMQSLRDWGAFIGDLVSQVSDVIAHLGELTRAVTAVGKAPTPAALTEAWRELRDVMNDAPSVDLARAWNDSFRGLDDEILDGFDQANDLLMSGWTQIRDAFAGEVSDQGALLVTTVTDSVATASGALTDWASLLGGDVTPPVEALGAAAATTGDQIEEASRQAEAASGRFAGWAQSFGDFIGRLVGDALDIDQPDPPAVAFGKAIVSSIQAGVEEALPSLRTRLLAAMGVLFDETRALANEAFSDLVSSGSALRTPAPPPAGGGAYVPDVMGQLAPFVSGPAWVDELTSGITLNLPDGVTVHDGPMPMLALTGPFSDIDTVALSRHMTDFYQSIRRFTTSMDEQIPPAGDRRPWWETVGAGAGQMGLPGQRSLGDPGVSSPGIATRDIVLEAFAEVPDAVDISLLQPIAEIRGGLVDLTGAAAGMTAVVEENAAAMAVIYRRELEARVELVNNLTTISADKGPIGNFGAALMGLAQDRIPAFDAVLTGFVQGGPIGALAGLFQQLVGESQAFQEFVVSITEALAPLAEILGKILTPVFRVLSTVVTAVVDALTYVWNALFGWIPGARVVRGGDDVSEPPVARERPVHSRYGPSGTELTSGGMAPAVQFGIALPLREAGELSLLAAQTQMSAARIFADAVGLMSERGFDVNLQTSTPVSRPAMTQLTTRASIVRT